MKGGLDLVIHLIPSSHWPPIGRPGVETLEPGRVFLYREGTYDPEVVLEAGQAGRVPAGTWVWIAESDRGYVTVQGGTIVIPPGHEEPGPRTVYWPAHPACRIDLAPEGAWSGVRRLDFVSVATGSVYPVDPGRRRSLWVPTGRLLAYRVGSRGLEAIDDLGSCDHGEVLKLDSVRPPKADQQEFLVNVRVPSEEGAPADPRELFALLEPPGRERTSMAPTARVEVGDRVSLFFLNVPARDDLDLVLSHSRLRTVSTPIEAVGGSVRELPEVQLRPRRTLSLEIDYRPKRPHRRAEIHWYHCGVSRVLGLRPLATCEPVGEPRKLEPGLQVYRFADLDDGKYYLEARIDDQVIPGLGAGHFPYLDPENEEPPHVDRALLHELEVHGHILVDGEPVPGEVQLAPVPQRDRTLPLRRFTTGEDLFYHLFYFGRLPGAYETPEGYEPGGSPEERLGLYGDAEISACTAEGYCRPYSIHSVLQGEGRLDFELGSPTSVEIQVLDAESAEPVEGAEVYTTAQGMALYFHHGHVEWSEPPGREGVFLRSGRNGRALLLRTEGGEIPIHVRHTEYEPYHGSLRVLDGEENRIAVRLERKGSHASGPRLLFPDGSPVQDAYLLALAPDGRRDGECSGPASRRGTIEVSDECLFGHTLVVIATGAAITSLEGAAAGSFGEIEIPRAPSRPLRVQVVDDEGRPVPGVPVALRYPHVTLTPNDFLLAATYTGYQPIYVTDDRGVTLLDGVDPDAVVVPDVGALLREDIEWFGLRDYRPGETVTVTVAIDR